MKHICPNKHTSYSLLKTQIEYACVSHVNFKITYYQLLNWMGGERKRDMIKRKEPRSSVASPSTATMVTTVVFPITHDLQERETLFSTFIFVSMEICYFSPICWFVPFFFSFFFFGIWLISNLVVWYWVLFLLVVSWVFIKDLVRTICLQYYSAK